jgi:hypothetical protein
MLTATRRFALVVGARGVGGGDPSRATVCPNAFAAHSRSASVCEPVARPGLQMTAVGVSIDHSD